jgi:uncharacterized repeat protein (TIGR03803 family)
MSRTSEFQRKCRFGASSAIAGLLILSSVQGAFAKRLYQFGGGNDGAHPASKLIGDGSGNLYGTTINGGSTDNCGINMPPNGCGTVFKLASDGTETVLHAFRSGGSDGAYPVAGLVADKTGDLYGITQLGGSGHGTVFEFSMGGSESILYAFKGGSDGEDPSAGLILDAAGNLYGTTMLGGVAASGEGTVFRLTPTGSERLLYSFCLGGFPACTDGSQPAGSLLRDKAGNLYGTTQYGGGATCYTGMGCGVVFKLTPSGTETVLHSFQGLPDGAKPVAGLVMDSSGNLYGTTQYGGVTCAAARNIGCGTIFRIAADGTETVLHAFQGGTDGAIPLGNLTIDSAGNLYGTTWIGGSGIDSNGGTVFELPAGGTELVLYAFTAGAGQGRGPEAGLLLKGNNLYGTANGGGTNLRVGGGYGVVFELKK